MPNAAIVSGLESSLPRARRLPRGAVSAAWRLAPMALVAAAIMRFAPWALAFLGAGGAVAAYWLLSRHGSTQAPAAADPWSPPERAFRAAGFLAGVGAFTGFLMLAVVPLVASAPNEERRQTFAALVSATVLVAAAIAMCAQGWRWRHALTLGAAALAAMAAVTAFSSEPPAAGDWATGFLRLAFVFVAAEALVPGRGPRIDVLGAAHAALAWLLLALAQRLPEDVAPGAMLEPWAWQSVMALLAAFQATQLWSARAALAKDAHWALRERAAQPMPPGLAATLGFLPAAALAPLAGWSLWAVAFGAGVAGSVACRHAWRGHARSLLGPAGV